LARAFAPDVLDRLRWMSDVLGPLLQAAVRRTVSDQGAVDITAIVGQMLQMGDEAHNRNRAGTLMLLRDLSPAMVTAGFDAGDVARCLRCVGGNDHFFLNLAMAAAPAILRVVGGTVPEALATTRRMQEITLGENPHWSVPVLDFRGVPTGIDVASVCRTGILPQINTGMAGRPAGVGQVGAGLVTPPAEIFPAALAALAARSRTRAGP
jgi:hypothetical protein